MHIDNWVYQMGKKRKKISKDTAEGIFAVAKAVALVGTLVYTLKGRSPTSLSKATDIVETAVKVGGAAKAADAGKEAVKEVAANAQKAARYEVQFKAFKTGEWYTKTLTDFKRSAYSVANTWPQGRASRVIDHLTGEIVNVFDGAPEIYAKYLK